MAAVACPPMATRSLRTRLPRSSPSSRPRPAARLAAEWHPLPLLGSPSPTFQMGHRSRTTLPGLRRLAARREGRRRASSFGNGVVPPTSELLWQRRGGEAIAIFRAAGSAVAGLDHCPPEALQVFQIATRRTAWAERGARA